MTRNRQDMYLQDLKWTEISYEVKHYTPTFISDENIHWIDDGLD